MVEALVGGVEAVDERVARHVASGIVGRVAVVETVRHHEVEDVVLRVDAHRGLHEEFVAGLGGAAARVAGVDGDVVRREVVAERDRVAVDRGERDVVGGIALVPALVAGDLELVAACRDLVGGELVETVTVGILHPRPETVRQPVARATELALEASDGGGDRRVDVVGHPVGLVVVVEGDVGVGSEAKGDVGTVRHGVGAVVLVPGVAERRLVLVVARRHGERGLPDAVGGVERELRGIAFGLPVARAAEFALQAPGDGDAGGVRGVVGAADRRQQRHPHHRSDACRHDPCRSIPTHVRLPRCVVHQRPPTDDRKPLGGHGQEEVTAPGSWNGERPDTDGAVEAILALATRDVDERWCSNWLRNRVIEPGSALPLGNHSPNPFATNVLSGEVGRAETLFR